MDTEALRRKIVRNEYHFYFPSYSATLSYIQRHSREDKKSQEKNKSFLQYLLEEI